MQVESFILDLLKKEVTEHPQPDAGQSDLLRTRGEDLGSISWPRKVTVHLQLRQVESFILDLLKKEVTEHLQPEADLSYGEETCWEQGVRI